MHRFSIFSDLASCNFNVTSISTTSISFLLYPLTSVAPDGYQVSWQPLSNASDLMKVYVMNNRSQREEFTLDDLTPGMLYHVMVQCYLANVTSVPSNKTVSTSKLWSKSYCFGNDITIVYIHVGSILNRCAVNLRQFVCCVVQLQNTNHFRFPN